MPEVRRHDADDRADPGAEGDRQDPEAPADQGPRRPRRTVGHGAAGELSKGQVMQVLVEMASGYLFVSAISGGSTIGVVAARDSDLGLVGFEIALLVERVGAQLTPALITELKNSLVAV